jgi:hypothetical protein
MGQSALALRLRPAPMGMGARSLDQVIPTAPAMCGRLPRGVSSPITTSRKKERHASRTGKGLNDELHR